LTRLRAANITAPIIAITADLINYDRQQALQADCSDFIEKPFSFEAREKLFTQCAV
jgi:CheY-like chemotaxis protein